MKSKKKDLATDLAGVNLKARYFWNGREITRGEFFRSFDLKKELVQNGWIDMTPPIRFSDEFGRDSGQI